MDQLRQRLLDELDTRPGGYPTWWARHHLSGVTTAAARAEFQRMESEGLVERHRHSSSNNILWVRAARATQGDRT